VQLLPKALNSDRTALCWPGVTFTGETKVRPPYMLAGLVAAGFCGLTPGEAMTNKTLKIAGLEYSPKNPTDTELLIKSGVLCAEETEDGYKVVRSISTHLSSDKYNRVEVSCGFAVDYVSRALRKAVDTVRGQGVSKLAATRALERAQTALEACADLGIIVGDDDTPAYRNLTATMSGDVIAVAVEVSPVIPANFLPITISAVPYSGTVSI
ncbi:MAG: hypothetical protein E7K72_26195, partial [Roseomonas mucosa]|nr:hypothetical protein [Roseomonas mucosa]